MLTSISAKKPQQNSIILIPHRLLCQGHFVQTFLFEKKSGESVLFLTTTMHNGYASPYIICTQHLVPGTCQKGIECKTYVPLIITNGKFLNTYVYITRFKRKATNLWSFFIDMPLPYFEALTKLGAIVESSIDLQWKRCKQLT